MLTSVAWLNGLLDGPDFSTTELVDLLEAHSFPIEAVETIPLSSGGSDEQLDVELTSNRGDCFSHVALAREIAAVTGRVNTLPGVLAGGELEAGSDGSASAETSVENRVAANLGETGACPRFTARLIKGVTVGPSPQWLQDALEAVGQRPINNIVDVSNYVLFEMGHPSHAFDFSTLAGGKLIVRHAEAGEKLTALDGIEHTLVGTDLVVADAEKPVSLAGVIGGEASGVTESTSDVLLEVATWDPATIRATARRLQITTDAGYRFERTVDPMDIRLASDRLVELIIEVAGGELVGSGEDSYIDEGVEVAPLPVVEVRVPRVEYVLGVVIEGEECERLLKSIGFGVEIHGDVLRVTIPANRRHEVTREIDVIEEISRLHGIDRLEVSGGVNVRLDLQHPHTWEQRERAVERLAETLTGQGFFETVTFSFLAERDAVGFVPAGRQLLKVDEERRKGTPFLRPSLVPSLLGVRRSNQDARVEVAGGVRLFEFASVFMEPEGSTKRDTIEERRVGLLMDVEAPAKHDQLQGAFRSMRGVIESTVSGVGGSGVEVAFAAADAPYPAAGDAAVASVSVSGQTIGYAALLSGSVLKAWGLDQPVVVAELSLPALIDLWPPKTGAIALPAFPGIRRDLSVIVEESVAYASIEQAVLGCALDRFESLDFVTTYRGKQVGAGKKSVTMSLGFRDPERTLRHEEVDPQIDAAVTALKSAVGAEIRS
jgi:phenylalanyl-tRNA synthetase beta chain